MSVDARAHEGKAEGADSNASGGSAVTVDGHESIRADHPGQLEAQMAMLFTRHWIPPTQRRVARYLMDHPSEGAFLSSIELAARAKVSQATVTRLAASVGFKGFSDLQKRLRTMALNPHGTAQAKGRNKLQAAVRAEIQNLQGLEASLADTAAVERIGANLAQSQPLVVLGVRMASFAASYFGYFAAKIHPDVRVVVSGGSSGFDQLSQARQAGATWLLGFVLPRYPREALLLLDHARSLGINTAICTDHIPSVVSDYADAVLSVSLGRRLVFDSHAAVVVLANILLEALSDANPTLTQNRLEEYERMVTDREVFVPGHDSYPGIA